MAARRMTSRMDRSSRSNRYYRNAVERHWDPGEVDLQRDVENFVDSELMDFDFESAGFEGGLEGLFDEFRLSIARFGAGEDAVTEDLAPLACVLEDFDDQLFITTQLYEEAKHADFFDRYWHEVIHTIEDEMGWERTDPRDDRWFDDAYLELFDRNERAMTRLLEEDTAHNRALAYCHYHTAIEGILAQTGYYGFQTMFGPDEYPLMPTLPGLVEGISRIRSDEGRHVGFGTKNLKRLVRDEAVDAREIESTIAELGDLVVASFETYEREMGATSMLLDLPEYAARKLDERIEQVLDADGAMPDVEELTAIEDA